MFFSNEMFLMKYSSMPSPSIIIVLNSSKSFPDACSTIYFNNIFDDISKISIPLSFIYLLPKQVEGYSMSVLSTLLFISNIWFWIEDGYSYWAPINEFKPLLHTWSLAVEEQFYISYPIFLIFVLSFFKKYFTGL